MSSHLFLPSNLEYLRELVESRLCASESATNAKVIDQIAPQEREVLERTYGDIARRRDGRTISSFIEFASDQEIGKRLNRMVKLFEALANDGVAPFSENAA